MKLLAIVLIALAGCTSLPMQEVGDVHTYVATWNFEAPEEFYANTAFRHCGNARLTGEQTGELLAWEGPAPTEILINRLAVDSDRVDNFSKESYHTNWPRVASPLDGKTYLVQVYNLPFTVSETRMVEDSGGNLMEVTETVTVEFLGAISMHIDRTVYGCD